MNNVTATIEFMYTDDFSGTINTSDKKALKQFFEQSCAKIAKDMKNNSIKECQLFFFYDGSEYEIDFDIMNIDSKYSYINVLFYDTFETLCDEVVETLAACFSVEFKNVTVDFYIKAFF